MGGIGFCKEVGANGDVGAGIEKPFWIEVKSGGIVGAEVRNRVNGSSSRKSSSSLLI